MKEIFLGNAVCAVLKHVDFKPIGWTKFVPFSRCIGKSEIKRWVTEFPGNDEGTPQ